MNAIEFLPELPKMASNSHECDAFKVINAASGQAVYTGNTTGPVYQKDVDQQVWLVDFSKLKKPGRYYLEVPGVRRSAELKVAEDVFDFAAKTSMCRRGHSATDWVDVEESYSHNEVAFNWQATLVYALAGFLK